MHSAPKFRDECRSSSHGQTDMSLSIEISNQVIARADYSIFEGRPALQMVTVVPEYRRRGYATMLVKELQRQYAGQEIAWGMLTEEGRLFYESLRKFEEPIPGMQEKFRELSQVRDKLTVAPDPESWNALHDRICELEKELQGQKSTLLIIDTGDDPVEQIAPAYT